MSAHLTTAHLSLETPDLHRLVERPRARAELCIGAPVRIEWGPYEGGYAARVCEPDGTTIELVPLPSTGAQL